MQYRRSVPRFGAYSRSHHQAVKIPNKNYYVHRIMLFYIIRM